MRAKLQRNWDRYLALWKKLTGWKLFLLYTVHYTVLFVILSYFVFSDFREAGKTFIWTTDGMPQHFTTLVYLSQTFRDGIQALLRGEGWTIPLYDFRLGPVKPSLSREPIQLLAVLWPWDRIDEFYNIMVIVRYYLVGLSFSVFGFYFQQKPVPILAGAVSYVFCGFSIYAGGVRHPFFMAPMIYLPLLVIGAEMILRKKRPYLFITVVFLALVSELYFACMLAIMVGIYALVRFPDIYLENRYREFRDMVGRMATSGGIGIALSGLVMLPTLLQMLGTGRIGRDVSYTSAMVYPESYYQKFLADLLIIPENIGSETCLGFTVLAVPAILMLFLRKGEKSRSLRIIFLILTGMLLIPGIAYVMSGFNSISNRWCFAYAFCVPAILMFEIPSFATADKRTLSWVAVGTVIYFIVCYFVIKHSYYEEAPFVLLVCCVVIFMIFRGLGQDTKRYQAGVLSLCLLFTCFSAYYGAFLMYDATQRNYVSEFTAEGKPYQYFEESQYGSFARSKAIEEDSTFYRVAGSDTLMRSMTSSFYTGINGLSFYSSYYFRPYMNWTQDAELAQMGSNIINHGIKARPVMLTLANVKYYVLRETGSEVAPYGFREIERIKNNGATDLITENLFALPIGYTYDSFLPHEEYEQLSALEREEAQLQSVVLKEDPISSDIAETGVMSVSKQLPAAITESTGLVWKDGVLKVTEEKATITLTFKGSPKAETYLRVVNLDLTNGASTRRWYLTAATEDTATSARFTADGWLYSHGMKTQILDLGYTEEGYTTCTITFPSKGTFKLEDLQIWCQSMDHYGEWVDALREESLENVETNWRGLTGTISVSKDKMLCIAVPYDEGWTAYVDGEKVKLYQANTAFMAVELSAGDHVVELKYWVPGLTAGICLSVAGAVGLVILVIYRRKKCASSGRGTRNENIGDGAK